MSSISKIVTSSRTGKYIIPQRRRQKVTDENISSRAITNFRNRRGLPNRISLVSPRSIVPARLIVVLPYVETLSLGSSFLVEYQMNLNSIFDPNRTGTGHQPLGHDEWNYFYQQYRVLAVRVMATFVNTSTSEPIKIAMVPSQNTTGLGSLDFEEQPFSRHFVLSTRGGEDVKRLETTYDLAKLQGSTHSQYEADEGTTADFGSSPTTLHILHVIAQTFSGVNAAFSVNIRLDYLTELSNPRQLVAS